jgi:hypothetical protein
MPGDSASTARIAYFTYKEYPERWNWIASIFSQESILQGSFDRFATETKGKKGTATVDEAILADIEEWRDVLAKNIALRNATLSVDELNVAVQKTLRPHLFLRSAWVGASRVWVPPDLLVGQGNINDSSRFPG